MVEILIDNKCTGCKVCVKKCPTEVFELVSKKARVKKLDDCMACKLCEVVCPVKAIQVLD